MGRSAMEVDSTHLVKRLQGLYRIVSDILLIEQMLKVVLNREATYHFEAYQGIVILYRKCFGKDDKRGVCLTEKKHLIGATPELTKLHLWLLEIANEHVAHSEKKEYDPVRISIIRDNATRRAISISVDQVLWSPLSSDNFQLLEKLVKLLKSNLEKEIRVVGQLIIDEYNETLDGKDQEMCPTLSKQNNSGVKELP